MRRCALLLCLVAGCIISSDDLNSQCGDGVQDLAEGCDDGNNIDGDGCSATCRSETTPHLIDARWSFATVDGTAGTCPAPVAIVRAWKVDANDAPIGDCTPGGITSENCYLDVVDCTSGHATTPPIPDLDLYPGTVGGRFKTSVIITQSDQTLVYAETLPDILDLTGADQTYPHAAGHGTIVTNGGYFGAAWTLRGASSGAELACSAANAASVVVKAVAGNTMVVTTLPCADGAGVSGALPEGSYEVSVTAVSQAGTPIGQATTLSARAIHGPNVVADLGGLQLAVDGQ